MASSKARSRNASARQARSGGSRPAARTSAQKTQAQRPQGQAQKPSAAPAQGQPQESPAATAQGPRQAAAPQATAQATRAKRQTAAVRSEPAAPELSSVPPLWFQLVTLALAVLGLAVSAYETYAHYTGSQLAGCPTGKGTFNCFAVITSPQSMIFGVFPVAVLGLIFYVVVTALMTPWAWRMQRREVGALRLLAMIVGMGFAMYLIYAEVVQIQQICEYCTGVHIITFVLFCFTVVAAAIWGLGKPARVAKAS
jgi:uncharacterized membrane protein